MPPKRKGRLGTTPLTCSRGVHSERFRCVLVPQPHPLVSASLASTVTRGSPMLVPSLVSGMGGITIQGDHVGDQDGGVHLLQ